MSRAPSQKMFLRPADVCEALSISRPTLYRWVRLGLFEKPIKIGPMLTGWRPETLAAWVASKEAQSKQAALNTTDA